MNIRIHREIWQGGLVLGTICLGLGVLYIIDPWKALPYSGQLLFVGASIGYFFSFFSFKKVHKIQKEKSVNHE